jgi:hypothetical protein
MFILGNPVSNKKLSSLIHSGNLIGAHRKYRFACVQGRHIRSFLDVRENRIGYVIDGRHGLKIAFFRRVKPP